jgi:hypothetical protein
MVSLMVHLFAGSLYGLFSRAVVRVLPQLASRQEPNLPKSDIIRLEKAQPTPAPVAAAQPQRKPPPPPPPVPHVAPRVVTAPVEEPHELAHLTIHAPRQTALSRGEGVAELPHVVRPAVAPPARKQPYYSAEQIAQMNGAFSQSIEATHQSLAQANAAMASTPVVTTKHFEMHFNGIHEGMNPGDGIITVLQVQHVGKETWYWTHYEYMYGDGHVEEDDIPWIFKYGPGDYDPFAHHDRRVPIQAPPPDYKPTRELKPILMQYFGGPQVG